MWLSHISYGTWSWDDQQLLERLEDKVYYRSSTVVDLYPVTVIALRRQGKQPDEQVRIGYQERMAHDGAALLNQIPAFNSIRKGGNYGFDPVFRGYKYDQLNVVLNGAQSATAACPNRMDPPTSQMAPNMMDRVEVLKGPHALRFGTGFGATINFVPSRLRFSPDADVYGRLSAGYEENGNLLRTEGQLGFSNSQYDLSLFGAWSEGDDYRAGNGQAMQADFLRGSFGSNLGLRLSPRQQLRVSALYNLARDADFPALPMDLRKDDTWLFNARHDIQFNKGSLQLWNTTAFASFVDHRMDNLLKNLSPRMMNASTDARTYNYGGRTEGRWQLPKAKLFAGADLRVEGAQGNRLRSFLMGPNAGKTVQDNAWQEGQITKTAAFAEYHLNTSTFNYILSARLTFNHAKINDPSAEFSELYASTKINQLNPSFSLGMQKTLEGHLLAGLWLGRAQRSGSLTERFINFFPVGQDPYEMLGNPALHPEINNQLDLTFQWKNKRTALTADFFVSYLQDLISSTIDTTFSPRLPVSPGVRQFVNIKEAFKVGYELNWEQQLARGIQHQFGIAYTYAQDLERAEPLPEIPPLDLRYKLKGSFWKDQIQPEIRFRYVMEQSRIAEQFGETITPSFALLDLQIAYQVTESWQFDIGINNLFDENYYEHLTRSVRNTTAPIYAPGRSFFANLSLLF